MLINQTDDMYWTVGPKTFYNKLLAADESKSTGLPIEFYFYDKTLDKFSFDVPDIWEWEELLMQRATEIRDNHKKIRLWYTGGRDSQLILDTFAKHNIPIDEVMSINNNYKNSEYFFILEFLKKNKHRYTNVKKFTQVEYSIDVQKHLYGKNWREQYFGGMYLPIASPGQMIQYHHEEGTANITGCEKSKTFVDHGKIYSYMYDATVHAVIGTPNHEPFYISGTLPIFQYQAQHIANYIKANLQDWSESELNGKLFTALPVDGVTIWDSKHPYYIGCEATLRPYAACYELGVPWAKVNGTNGSSIDTQAYGDIERQWKQHYPEIYKNFHDGIVGVDTTFGKFFNEEDPTKRFKPTSSKRYFIAKR